MGLLIPLAVFFWLLLVFFLVQAVTGHEIVRLGKRRRPAARVRREYTALSIMSVGTILLTVPGLSPWWGIAVASLGLIASYAVQGFR